MIDPRFAGVFEIARDTGDDSPPYELYEWQTWRSSKGKTVTTDCDRLPAKTDKARRRGRAFVIHARPGIEALLGLPEVETSGWLFPRGSYHGPAPMRD